MSIEVEDQTPEGQLELARLTIAHLQETIKSKNSIIECLRQTITIKSDSIRLIEEQIRLLKEQIELVKQVLGPRLIDLSVIFMSDGSTMIELFFEERRVLLDYAHTKSAWAIVSMPPHKRDGSGKLAVLDTKGACVAVADVLKRAYDE